MKQKYVVTNADGTQFSAGDVVTEKEGYEGVYERADGVSQLVDDHNIRTQTPAELRGFKVGDKATVVDATDYGEVKVGDTVTMVRDDGDNTPLWLLPNGNTGYMRLFRVGVYVAPQVEVEVSVIKGKDITGIIVKKKLTEDQLTRIEAIAKEVE